MAVRTARATRGKENSDFSSLISVKSFKEYLSNELSEEDIEMKKHEPTHSELAEAMGVSPETVAELDEVCSPANLKGPAEPSDLDSVDIYNNDIPPDTDLSSLRLLKERKGKITHFRKEVNYFVKESVTRKGAEEHKAIEETEVLLSIAIYHPKMLNKVQEFLVLSHQKLTSLRDKIYCASDHVVPGDHSDNPNLLQVAKCKDICKSGFFYIENVFYNDMRDGLSRDYSRIITDWAKDSDEDWSTKLKEAQTKSMDESVFGELTIRLGYPYLYCHQGNCEHLIIFTDLRLLHVDDSKNAMDYPLQVFKHRCRRRRCRVCNIYTAEWVTKNDILASEDPSFFCDKCFKSLHYAKGEKLCDFEAYPFMGYSDW
ncbi:snRNA-activating protein complex subunit 3-like [Actinia tenebrosa]|uniref:snRNA-activating protein complex subunit 3 n=1 Tax=Actinia tenebrosa TaxID=6105 RepID=A0A6P8HNU8_ACTTE|nr:snRNA-activating protein complex subunit 3-like [Actinia tenebrosa]